MARPATGSVCWDEAAKVWTVRVTLANGSRSRPIAMALVKQPCAVRPADPERGCECPPCRRASDEGRRVSERMRDGASVDAATQKTVNEWFEDWLAARVAKGLRSTANDRTRFTKWISPVIGPKPIALVVRRDLEELVERLDKAVRAKQLSWKTATNIWGVASKMFSDACRSKVLALRVRDDNPAREVQAPDRGIDRSGPYLFPTEVAAIMRCKRVPPRWKRLIAIAVYAYVRRGELDALDCADVNTDRGYIHVHRAVDGQGDLKPTKTGDTRKVPIEPTLLPLLERMREAAKNEGRLVISMPPSEEMAKRLRRYVAWACEDAGIELREELLADDETRRPLVWHDLRHTGITWRAVRGDDPLKVQRASGHTDLRTTQRYINEAQTFEDAATFGVPFPALPVDALMAIDGAGSGAEGFRSSFAISDRAAARKPEKTVVCGRPQGDSNATESASHASTAQRDELGKTESKATLESTANSTDLAGQSPAESQPATSTRSADDALRDAIKAAVDEGDVERAKALLAILAPPRPGVRDVDPSENVVSLATRRAR
jgi:integrase